MQKNVKNMYKHQQISISKIPVLVYDRGAKVSVFTLFSFLGENQAASKLLWKTSGWFPRNLLANTNKDNSRWLKRAA